MSEKSEKPVIEGFEIHEKLGETLMSTVWKAEQKSLRRPAVIKILSEDLSGNFDDIKQFMFEARVAANLKHPNIVQVYDFGQAENRYYFVMEFISGYTVGDWQRRKGRIDEQNCMLVAHAVAGALRYAWEQSQIIHCDLKPDNIMVDGDGTIKLMDLGLSKVAGLKEKVDEDNEDDTVVVGTPNYISPEQAKGDANLDFRTDMYAFGATIYHLLTGELPFGDSPPDTAMEQQCNDYLKDPREFDPAISVSAVCFIAKLMAKDPVDRHKSWAEVVDDLCLVENGVLPAGALPSPGASTVASDLLEKRPAGNEVNSAKATSSDQAKDEIQSAPAADVPEQDVYKECKYCAEQIKKNAVICRFCGKTQKKFNPPPADDGDETRTTRPKPKKKAPPAPAQPPVAASQQDSAASFIARRKRKARFWANFRMLLSVVLIGFTAYYFYMRFAQDKDVLIPVRDSIRSVVNENAPAILRSFDDIMSRFSSDKPEPAPVAVDPVQNDSEWEEMFPEEAPEPEVSETPAEPEEEPEPIDITQTPEYLKILEKCRELQPKLGDMITIKGQDSAHEGIIEEINPGGVLLRLPEGTITCSFAVMEENMRQSFFPEERAAAIYQRLKKSGRL